MKKELQDKIFEKYPKLYRQKDLDMRQTAMCWGISCGDGWYNIIDNLSQVIQDRSDWLNGEGIHEYRDLPEDHVKESIEAVQVKEKYGWLRFYVNYTDSYIDGAISLAESLSYKTCETCGNLGEVNESGWRMTRCESCKGKASWESDNVQGV